MRRGIIAFICLCGVASLVGAVDTAAAAPPPSNDDLAAAQVLSGPLPLQVTGSTVGATREVGEPTHEGWIPAGHSVWYRWVAPRTEYISINTCGSEDREDLVVYEGSAYGALREITANAYTYLPECGWGGETEVSFTAVAGRIYSISVDGDGRWSEDPSSVGEGSLELEVSRPAPPANDDFAAAEPVTAREGDPVFEDGPTFDVDDRGASKEAGEPDHRGNPGGASVWFSWTAPRSGGATVNACYENEGLVAVYTGSTVRTLTAVPSVESYDTCDYSFFAVAGVTYDIAVDGKLNVATGAPESFSSRGEVRYFPPNDQFELARPLDDPFTGKVFTDVTIVGYGNYGATKQPGEPNHAGDPGGASVWFEWTAPQTGSVQISACQAGFSPLLAVYTGDEVTRLTPVASAVGSAGAECPTDSRAAGQVAFNVHDGVTYDIAVDGVGGSSGRFDLALLASDRRLPSPAPGTPTPGPSATSTVVAAKPKPPNTKIAARHIDPSRDSISFRLGSNLKGSTFRCKLDKRKFSKCGAKVTYRHLAPGAHVFRAEAVGPTGLVDPSPLRDRFSIAPIPR
jgi:hypothetical protein